MKSFKISFFNTSLYIFYFISAIYFLLSSSFSRASLVIISLISLFIFNYFYKKGFYVIDETLLIISNLFILFSLVLGSSYNFYDKFTYYDTLLHFSSGFIATKISYNILGFLKLDDSLTKFMFFIILFLSSMGFAPICEIYEYLADTFFGGSTQSGGLNDTMIDMISSSIGIIIMVIYYYISSNTYNKEF